MTYRVVQVTDQHLDGRDDAGGAVSVVSTAAFAGTPQAVAQVTTSTLTEKDPTETQLFLKRNCILYASLDV